MPSNPPPPPQPMPPPPLGYRPPAAPIQGSLGSCPSCGTEIRFCSHCGAALDAHGDGHPPTAPQPGVPTSAVAIYDVVIHDPGRKKIQVIKTVRELTGLGLKEAKDLVDSADLQPAIVISGVNASDAQAMAAALTSSGAAAVAQPQQPR